jgi:hypothetical protein
MAHYNLTKNTIFILIGVILSSCSSYPESPELVVEEFVMALSSSDCEKALEYSTGNARLTVNAAIEMGCEENIGRTEIDSISCVENEGIAECICYETRTDSEATPSVMSYQWPYDLKKIEGEWKITNVDKCQCDMDETDPENAP